MNLFRTFICLILLGLINVPLFSDERVEAVICSVMALANDRGSGRITWDAEEFNGMHFIGLYDQNGMFYRFDAPARESVDVINNPGLTNFDVGQRITLLADRERKKRRIN